MESIANSAEFEVKNHDVTKLRGDGLRRSVHALFEKEVALYGAFTRTQRLYLDHRKNLLVTEISGLKVVVQAQDCEKSKLKRDLRRAQDTIRKLEDEIQKKKKKRKDKTHKRSSSKPKSPEELRKLESLSPRSKRGSVTSLSSSPIIRRCLTVGDRSLKRNLDAMQEAELLLDLEDDTESASFSSVESNPTEVEDESDEQVLFRVVTYHDDVEKSGFLDSLDYSEATTTEVWDERRY